VAKGDSTYSAPAMNAADDDTDLAAVGHGNSLKFYWELNGTTTWHAEQVAKPGSVR
jgi:hypothetical protein